MRRLSAILMIAALVAALVPSATLAGKPPPVVDMITGIEWISLGGGAGECSTQVNVHHDLGKGAPRMMKVGAVDGNNKIWGEKVVKADRSGVTVGYVSLSPSTVTDPIAVFAELWDNKQVERLYYAFTSQRNFFSSCPISGSTLGSFGTY